MSTTLDEWLAAAKAMHEKYEAERAELIRQRDEAVTKWISVKEQSPGEGVRVLVQDDGEDYYPRIALLWTMNGVRFWHLDTAKNPASMIPYEYFTHWMALPSPPNR